MKEEEIRKQIKEIITVEQKQESDTVPIIENKTKKKLKNRKVSETIQYKIIIPKKYANAINLNKNEFEAKIYLEKRREEEKTRYKLWIEIKNKNDKNGI